MAGHAAVGVDDDLAAGEAGVADRAADHEAAGRVDEEVLLRVQLRAGRRARRGRIGCDHVLPEVGADQRVGVDAVLVLGRDQDLLDLDRAAVLVADRDLGLAVGPQVGDDLVACGPRRAGARAGGRARSAAASAPASRWTRSRTSSPGRRRPATSSSSSSPAVRVLERVVDALGDVGRLLVDRVDDARTSRPRSRGRRRCSRSRGSSRARSSWMST